MSREIDIFELKERIKKSRVPTRCRAESERREEAATGAWPDGADEAGRGGGSARARRGRSDVRRVWGPAQAVGRTGRRERRSRSHRAPLRHEEAPAAEVPLSVWLHRHAPARAAHHSGRPVLERLRHRDGDRQIHQPPAARPSGEEDEQRGAGGDEPDAVGSGECAGQEADARMGGSEGAHHRAGRGCLR